MIKKGNYVLQNYMEEIVLEMMDDILSEMNVCKCDRCIIDVAGKALNDLPTKYFVTEKGKLYSKIDVLKNQFEVDIITAITKAAILVKRSPNHT